MSFIKWIWIIPASVVVLLGFAETQDSNRPSFGLHGLPNGLWELPPEIRSCRISDGTDTYLIDMYAVLRLLTDRGTATGGYARLFRKEDSDLSTFVADPRTENVYIDSELVRIQPKSSPLTGRMLPGLADPINETYIAVGSDKGTRYLIDHGRKRRIRNESFASCQFGSLLIRNLSDQELAAFPDGEDFAVVVAQTAPSPPTPTPPSAAPFSKEFVIGNETTGDCEMRNAKVVIDAQGAMFSASVRTKKTILGDYWRLHLVFATFPVNALGDRMIEYQTDISSPRLAQGDPFTSWTAYITFPANVQYWTIQEVNHQSSC
jgi:hypothetical protein